MISGILLTIALFGALATVKTAMTSACMWMLMNGPKRHWSTWPETQRGKFVRYSLSILLFVLVTIAASFGAGVYV